MFVAKCPRSCCYVLFFVVEFHGFVAGYCVVFELDPARNTCVVPAGESPRISELCDVNRNRFSRGAMKTTTTTATRKQRKHLAQVFLFHIWICIEGEKITISTSLPWNEVRSFSDVLMNFTWIEATHNVLSMPTWLFSWVVNSFLTGWTKGHPEKQWKFNI